MCIDGALCLLLGSMVNAYFFSPSVDTNIDHRASYQQLDPEAFVRANTVTAALRAMTGASTPVTVS